MAIFSPKQRDQKQKMKRTHLSLAPNVAKVILGERKLKFGLRDRSWWYVRHDTKNPDNVVISAHFVRAGQRLTSQRSNEKGVICENWTMALATGLLFTFALHSLFVSVSWNSFF
jgi:hypothetical protein